MLDQFKNFNQSVPRSVPPQRSTNQLRSSVYGFAAVRCPDGVLKITDLFRLHSPPIRGNRLEKLKGDTLCATPAIGKQANFVHSALIPCHSRRSGNDRRMNREDSYW